MNTLDTRTTTRTALFTALMLAAATAFATPPSNQQVVEGAAETAAAVNATEAAANTSAAVHDMRAAKREMNRAAHDAKAAHHAKKRVLRRADRRGEVVNATTADLNAGAAAMGMAAADREAARAAGDMQVAVNAKDGVFQTSQTQFTQNGQTITVRSVAPLVGADH
jgi:hypothetical protein